MAKDGVTDCVEGVVLDRKVNGMKWVPSVVFTVRLKVSVDLGGGGGVLCLRKVLSMVWLRGEILG